MPPATPLPVFRRRGGEHQATVHPIGLAPGSNDPRRAWRDAYRAVRAETEARAAPLGPEDQVVQSMPDTSPTKWHLAHTTWFFEQFLLVPWLPGYEVFCARFGYLFNSYYVAAGPRHARPLRGLLTRPDSAQVAAYRGHVDQAVERLLASADVAELAQVLRILEIGLHHEQQHQELILTDILHALAQSPIAPAYAADWREPEPATATGFAELPRGIHRIGWPGEGFCFDNECPAHDVLLPPARIAHGLVTNAQWLEFIAHGGYATPTLWLSDGWAQVEVQGWGAPGYWEERDGAWSTMTLAGRQPLDPHAAVSHVSYYEADAFARWAGKDLPTEAQWEVAAGAGLMDDAYGIVWQWTRSAYCPYPGYRAAPGALGEQRQVHGQSDGAARQLARDPGRPCTRELPQFLSPGGALAIQRRSPGGISAIASISSAPVLRGRGADK